VIGWRTTISEEAMTKSSERILTSHAGSLPRPDSLLEAWRSQVGGNGADASAFEGELRRAVADLVRRQRDLGLDIINDGEYGHAMGGKLDYAAWWTYVFQRLDGLELKPVEEAISARRPRPEDLKLGAGLPQRRDYRAFQDAYEDPSAGITLGEFPSTLPVATSAITYVGQEAVQQDIANFKAALEEAGLEDGFLNSVAPASCARFGNAFYDDDDELLWACAEAMREEYKAIIDAGLMLQLDDPAIAENWDGITPAPTPEEYRRYTRRLIEALNHAIRDLPPERIRFHLCWGSWHGPHTTDLPMAEIAGLMLEVNAGSYSFEAANVRHEHEWRVWEEVKLPEGKVLVPGVVSHSTNVVEHPELVADRIVRFAERVGRENVVAATDCGLGGRIHPQIAWAKLDALVQGADLATKRLWT
jgi:5-methyltetrahydropteroyltriglutamate--homocysteine methyltransferase